MVGSFHKWLGGNAEIVFSTLSHLNFGSISLAETSDRVLDFTRASEEITMFGRSDWLNVCKRVKGSSVGSARLIAGVMDDPLPKSPSSKGTRPSEATESSIGANWFARKGSATQSNSCKLQALAPSHFVCSKNKWFRMWFIVVRRYCSATHNPFVNPLRSPLKVHKKKRMETKIPYV